MIFARTRRVEYAPLPLLLSICLSHHIVTFGVHQQMHDRRFELEGPQMLSFNIVLEDSETDSIELSFISNEIAVCI